MGILFKIQYEKKVSLQKKVGEPLLINQPILTLTSIATSLTKNTSHSVLLIENDIVEISIGLQMFLIWFNIYCIKMNYVNPVCMIHFAEIPCDLQENSVTYKIFEVWNYLQLNTKKKDPILYAPIFYYRRGQFSIEINSCSIIGTVCGYIW